jgi:tRNA(adenine34) deaminase
MNHQYYMKEALIEANKAYKLGEVPIGAVLVNNNIIVARNFNYRECSNDPTAHAEIRVIREGAIVQGNWRLYDCTLYVTLEPCPMCAGAILNSRIKRLVFGAFDPKAGAVGTVVNLLENN